MQYALAQNMLIKDHRLQQAKSASAAIMNGKDAEMPPPPRILIVEDERILAENLKEYLGRRVLDVRAVSDGEQAVEILDTFEPDAILMDYRLPGMNGLDTYTEMMRKHAKKIDCVMISGDPTEDLGQSANNAGIRSILSKPFSFAELLESLEPPPANEVDD